MNPFKFRSAPGRTFIAIIVANTDSLLANGCMYVVICGCWLCHSQLTRKYGSIEHKSINKLPNCLEFVGQKL